MKLAGVRKEINFILGLKSDANFIKIRILVTPSIPTEFWVWHFALLTDRSVQKVNSEITYKFDNWADKNMNLSECKGLQ